MKTWLANGGLAGNRMKGHYNRVATGRYQHDRALLNFNSFRSFSIVVALLLTRPLVALLGLPFVTRALWLSIH